MTGQMSPMVRSSSEANHLAANGTRGVRTEPRYGGGYVFAPDVSGLVAHARKIRFGANGCGRECVRAYAVRAFFLGDGAHERDDAALRGRIGPHASDARTGECGCRREVDDGAMRRPEEREEGARGEICSGDVDGALRGPCVDRAVGDGSRHAETAGDVDQRVESRRRAGESGDIAGEGGDLRFIGEVTGERFG